VPNWLILLLFVAACTLVGPGVIWIDAKSRGDPRAGARFTTAWMSYVSYLGALAAFGAVIVFLAWLAG
jgi:hypothetical protein